jgi:hypothetical protein
LTGYPGTGKFTIAKELVRQLDARGETTRLVDNHRVGDPILGLIPISPEAPVPPEVWDRVRAVAAIVRDTIATISPVDWSFVFTNYVADIPADRAHYPLLAECAATRGSVFVPVCLTVELDELLQRTMSPERLGSNKITNPDLTRRLVAERGMYRPDYPQRLEIDVTNVSPAAAAARIIEHADSLRA